MPLRWAQEGTLQPASWASPTPSDLTSAVRISAKGGRTLSVGGAALVRGQLPGQGRYGPGCGPPQPAVGGLKIVSILGTAIDSPNASPDLKNATLSLNAAHTNKMYENFF